MLKKYTIKRITKNVNDFLTRATKNIKVKSITTDSKAEYKKVIEKLGFKQQYCLIHISKALNKDLITYHRINHTDPETIEKDQEDMDFIYEILNNPDTEQSYNDAMDLYMNLNKLCEPLIKFVTKKLIPYFKTLTLHHTDKNIPKTTSKIENYFRKTMPRHKKYIFKTIEGITARINFKIQKWNKNNQKINYAQSF